MSVSCSVVLGSLQPHGLQPARILKSLEFSRQEYAKLEMLGLLPYGIGCNAGVVACTRQVGKSTHGLTFAQRVPHLPPSLWLWPHIYLLDFSEHSRSPQAPETFLHQSDFCSFFPSSLRRGIDSPVVIRRGEGSQMKRCRDSRCSLRGNPGCRGTFGVITQLSGH